MNWTISFTDGYFTIHVCGGGWVSIEPCSWMSVLCLWSIIRSYYTACSMVQEAPCPRRGLGMRQVNLSFSAGFLGEHGYNLTPDFNFDSCPRYFQRGEGVCCLQSTSGGRGAVNVQVNWKDWISVVPTNWGHARWIKWYVHVYCYFISYGHGWPSMWGRGGCSCSPHLPPRSGYVPVVTPPVWSCKYTFIYLYTHPTHIIFGAACTCTCSFKQPAPLLPF